MKEKDQKFSLKEGKKGDWLANFDWKKWGGSKTTKIDEIDAGKNHKLTKFLQNKSLDQLVLAM